MKASTGYCTTNQRVASQKLPRQVLLVAAFFCVAGLQVEQSQAREVEYTFSGRLDGDFDGQTYEVTYLVDESLFLDFWYPIDDCFGSRNCVRDGLSSEYQPIKRVSGRMAEVLFDLRSFDGPYPYALIADDYEEQAGFLRDAFTLGTEMLVFPEGEQSTFLLTSTSVSLSSSSTASDVPSTSLDGVLMPLAVHSLDPRSFQSASVSFHLLDVVMSAPGVFSGGESRVITGSIDSAVVREVPEPTAAALLIVLGIGYGVTRLRVSSTRLMLLGVAAIGATPTQESEAAVVVTASEVDGDVVLTGSGSLDLTGFQYVSTAFSSGALVRANPAEIMLGGTSRARIDVYRGPSSEALSLPGGLGASARNLFADSGSGDRFGLLAGFSDPSETLLNVPEGYRTGDPLEASSTYIDTSFSELGIAPGEYTWSLAVGGGFGGIRDIFILQVVPEPTSGAMGGLALLATCFVRPRRRHASSPDRAKGHRT